MSDTLDPRALEKLIQDAYVRGVEWNEENPLDRDYRFKAAEDYADKTISALRASPQPADPAQVTDAMVEMLAEFLCSEFDEDFNPCHGYSWPEHKDDDGYRGGNAYVKLQPSDVQARAREGATRILTFLSQRTALTAAIGAGGPAVAWRYKSGVGNADSNWLVTADQKLAETERRYPNIVEPLYARPAPSGQAVAHSDDLAVDRFAVAMKAKLAKKRAEGRGGWDDRDECTAEHLSYLLVQHIIKGDPLDVGNLAMMLHQRGDRIVIDDETRSIAAALQKESQL